MNPSLAGNRVLEFHQVFSLLQHLKTADENFNVSLQLVAFCVCLQVCRIFIFIFVITWMELEDTLLSEICQTQKDKYCMVSFICGIF